MPITSSQTQVQQQNSPASLDFLGFSRLVCASLLSTLVGPHSPSLRLIVCCHRILNPFFAYSSSPLGMTMDRVWVG
jgi:hypothetical protein